MPHEHESVNGLFTKHFAFTPLFCYAQTNELYNLCIYKQQEQKVK